MAIGFLISRDSASSRLSRRDGSIAPSGLELLFDSLTQGGTAFVMGYLDSLAPARSALSGLRLRRIPFAVSQAAKVFCSVGASA